jgi:hypothetical protein
MHWTCKCEHMKHDEFKAWLTNVYETSPGSRMNSGTIAARLSNCRRVEEYEGDLDAHAAENRGELLRRLTYSTEDAGHARPPMHRIPIAGDKYYGTATLRSAVNLYFKFADHPGSLGDLRACGDEGLKPKTQRKKSVSARAWPTWDQPSESEALTLARIISRHVRFIAPEVVDAVVRDNERHRNSWAAALGQRGIDPNAYLWERSSCAFPGVRRYAGSHEIAVFRKKASAEELKIKDALRIDDNDYPKQIWSFVFLGKKFPKNGPVGYSLAHLADHKNHGNRFDSDFEVVQEPRSELFGLYTCLTNAAYVPSSMIKPTDFGARMRNLLMRRAEQLYGAHCSLLPQRLRIRSETSPDWHVDAFEWAAPVGDSKDIDTFLEYRNTEMERLFAAAPFTGPPT